jgi:hypothetical protein
MMLPSADHSFDTFWRQAVRWLAIPAQDPIVVEPSGSVSPGDTVQIRTMVRNAAFDPLPDADVDVRVTDPAGETRSMRAGRVSNEEGAFVAPVEVKAPGVYRVTADARRGGTSIGTPETSLLVGGSDLEMTDPRLNLQVLERIALATSGRVVAPQDFATVVDALRRRVPAARLSVTKDLWHTGWIFGALVVLLGSEWILRRRWGLR